MSGQEKLDQRMLEVVDDPTHPEVKIIKIFRIVPKKNVRFTGLGVNVVKGRMKTELMKKLGESIPCPGSCLLDWNVTHHTVDELDESGKRWPLAREGDVVVQGYLRFQIPEVPP